jgi:class 3 adenylate cyclase
VVLTVQFLAGTQAATALFRTKGDLLVELIASRVRAQLDPASAQLSFVAEVLSQPEADYSRARIADLLTGALAGAPSIYRVAFLYPDAQLVVVDRGDEGAYVAYRDERANPLVREGLAEANRATGGKWGEFIFTPQIAGPSVNRRHSVWRNGKFLGALVAIVPLRQLSVIIAQSTVNDYGGTPFILYGDDEVLAHPRLLEDFPGLSPQHPLPSLAEIGDPVLAHIWARRRVLPLLEQTATFHSVEVAGEPYMFLHKPLPEFGAVPWTVGAYFHAGDIAGNLRTLLMAGASGVLTILVALAIALWMAQRFARPTQAIAEAANRLAELDFDRAKALPRSSIRELDDQAAAFNRLLAALRWFETYVPRKLVRQLAQGRARDGIASQTREVTVMFSDIVGFTTRSQSMTPGETAALLNRHFAVAIDAIEATGGTVDKFMGDGIMAFWGAPEPLPGHAKAALDAARAIAASTAGGDVRLRLGLHTGLVVAGNVGSERRLNYTILGDAVNVTNRIEQLGHDLMAADETCCVLASGETYEQAGAPADFAFAGEFILRGRAEPVSVWRLTPDAAAPPTP